MLWATQYIRGGGQIGPLHELITQGIHPQVRIVLIRMLQEPELASTSVLQWIDKIAAKKNHGNNWHLQALGNTLHATERLTRRLLAGAISKGLNKRIQQKAVEFKNAAQGMSKAEALPFSLMEVVESYSARVLDKVKVSVHVPRIIRSHGACAQVLDELEDTALEPLREKDSIGYTALQKAAAQVL